MANPQQKPTTTPEPDETPKSTFGNKLNHYAFTPKSPASPKRPLTRSTSTLQQPILNYLTPPKPSSQTLSPNKRKTSPSPSKTRKPSPSSNKKRKKSRHPTTSPSHPNNLHDALAPNLLILFIGCNPGLQTARTGHAYAHPSNLFYKLLHASLITPRLCHPSECYAFPSLFNLGNTNIVTRVTRDASELSKEEMDAGVSVLEEKCRVWRPEVVCLVGKGVWESVWRVRHGGRGFRAGEFRYGWQTGEGERMGVVRGEWEGARVFVATTTSGLAAGMGWGEKVEVWRELGEWVGRRRGEREMEGRAEKEMEGRAEGDKERGGGKGGGDGREED